jgi:hypothetical protein
MRKQRFKLYDKKQTGDKMKWLINKYNTDITNISTLYKNKRVKLCDLPLKAFFNYVKKIKYRQDYSPVEIISRPYYIIKHKYLGMDCKKKAVLIGCYLKYNGIPYRLIASSNKPDKRIHHVFPQAFLSGQWINTDATYNHYKFAEPKNVTRMEVL